MRYHLRSRERILGFGVGGVGKSTIALQIASMLDDGDVMYVIETDPTYDRLTESEEFADLGFAEEYWNGKADEDFTRADDKLVVYHCDGWEAVRDAIEEVWGRAERNDWIVLDNATTPWEAVQEWYWNEVVGEEMDAFLLQIRKERLKADSDDQGKATEEKFSEWSYINPHYKRHMTDRLLNPPCHLYITAEQGDVVKHFDEKNKELWGLYGSLGVKPKGQKKLPHITHTVLHLATTGTGRNEKYVMTTIKDRGRGKLTREPWDDFVEDYLVGVAGWDGGDDEPEPTPAPRRRKA